ncbi:hypothetical protein MNBD_NITROSPINAE01-559 [hydrothermal vent metagenome]|uniref:DUF1318 domain-containing protein n=1 Tax=hydrothermal vent metagenome TaxID=652676 RepID=A0A3B1BSS8_9ZZZZ
MVQVKIDVVDQRTALENQVLGSYEELSSGTLLLASVRSIDSEGRLKPTPPMPDGKRVAVRAMLRSQYNNDDIAKFKAENVFGETNKGYLAFFETEKIKADAKTARLAKEIMQEENEDRETIYTRILKTSEALGEGDMPQVEAIMAGLNRDTAKPGELIQADSGEWSKK